MPERVLRERVKDGRHRMAIALSFWNRQKREIDKLGGVRISIFREQDREKVLRERDREKVLRERRYVECLLHPATTVSTGGGVDFERYIRRSRNGSFHSVSGRFAAPTNAEPTRNEVLERVVWRR